MKQHVSVNIIHAQCAMELNSASLKFLIVDC